MDSVLVDVGALALPGVKLTPGRVIMARVVRNDAGGSGELAIGGGRLSATLPASLRAGEELRLVVAEVSAGRVVLRNEPLTAPREGGEGEGEGEGAGRPTATPALDLRYDAQRLGPIDLQLELRDGALAVVVGVGSPHALASAKAAADELRSALAAATGLAVGVSVRARQKPLDLYV
jgi:hypothetical protein